MLKPIVPCMGGWCPVRDRCRHCVEPMSDAPPSERLCAVGQEQPEPIKEPLGTGEPAREQEAATC